MINGTDILGPDHASNDHSDRDRGGWRGEKLSGKAT